MLSIIAGVSNASRGGQWRHWLGLPDTELRWLSSDAINTTVYGLVVLYLTSNIWLAMASAVAMYLGAKDGWGDYIGALFRTRIDNLQEIKSIDPYIRCLRKYPEAWGFTGLALRGFLWGTLLAIPFAVFGYQAIAANFVLIGAYMPWAYLAAYHWIRTRTSADVGSAWGLGEVFWGIMLWSPLY